MTTWWRVGRRAIAPVMLVAVIAVGACGRKAANPPRGVRAPTPAALDSVTRTPSAGGSGRGGAAGTSEAMPVILAGGRAADSAAMAPLVLSFASIGYRNGITLVGTTDEATIAIPVNDGLRPATLRLRIIPTPRMPPATLVLRQRDHILAMRDVTDTTTMVTLPIGDVVVQDGKATLTLGFSVPGRDLCQAQLFYRTVFTPQSQVEFTGTPRPTTAVNGFFQPWVERVTFYLAEQPSLDAAQAALDAAVYVARRYRGMSTVFEIKPLPPEGTPLREPGPWARALVWTPTGGTMVVRPDSGGRGTLLAIAARRDARQLFTLADGADLVPSPGFKAGSADLGHNTMESDSLIRTLADLGFASRTIDGNSLLVASYPVSLADFGNNVIPTSFRLVAKHSVLPPNGNGTVRVHLNGSLIYSRALEHDGLDVVVPIRTHLLRRDNVFEVRFQVVLGEGACVSGGQVFTATIDDESSFITDGRAAVAPGFGRFPAAFVPAFSVLLEPRDRFRVDLAASVIGAMQQTTRTPLAPGLARDRAEATGPLLAVGTTSLAEALDAPLHSDGVSLRDRSGKVWDEFAPNASYGAMQGWEKNGNDVLLLHHTGADGQPLADLLREELAPYGWFGLRGDLAVRGPQGPTRTLTVTSAGWRLEPEPGAPTTLLIRYKAWIFGAIAFILFILLVWLRPRVVRSELDTAG